jgi:beta-galactosidase
LPAGDAGKIVWLEFDGIYRNALIWLNGRCIGRDVSGYAPISFDVSSNIVAGGTNVLVMRVDASRYEGWFYEGAGIYRHVWLETSDPVHVAHWGTYAATTSLVGSNATIMVQTTVTNQSSSTTVNGSLTSALFDANSNMVTTVTSNLTLVAGQGLVVTQTMEVVSANLWSLRTPYLYNLVSIVSNQNVAADAYTNTFGIRTIRFDATNGVFINGQHVELQGMSDHQDHAGVGIALPDRLLYYRIERSKEMGVTAYRCAHDPPTSELLNACDRLGLLVLDENRRVGTDPESLGQLQRMILRDRNHPCIFAWSLGNEEYWLQYDSTLGPLVMNTMQNLAHSLDNNRLCTIAANGGYQVGVSAVADVVGFNYSLTGSPDSLTNYHAVLPKRYIMGTEQASTTGTRGMYADNLTNAWLADYDVISTNFGTGLSWTSPAETWWPYFLSRPFSCGGFVWTGFDYRGEPTPYGWPCVNSHFGLMDTCGFPKDNYYYYQSVWLDKPMVHLLPHWNWPDKKGQKINVWCYSNCKQVELFLNGQSLGRQTMPKNSHLEWNMAYAPVTLSAKGYDTNGAVIAETKVETTGAPSAVQLTPNRQTISADGEDVSIITVSVTDSQRRVVPIASNKIHFALSGPGRIIGVGNGDPSCHEPDQFITMPPARIQPVNDWRWEKIRNAYRTNLPEEAENFDDSKWQTADVNTATGPLEDRASAAFRGHFNVTAEDLATPAIVLTFHMIDDEGYIYVNGQRVGESHNWQTPMTLNVKPFLHPGENTIAVSVANWTGPGGINKGVELKFEGVASPADWQRSVFNGLAQIIVQSTKQPGQIVLTAQADGLEPETLQLTAQPAPLRPVLVSE